MKKQTTNKYVKLIVKSPCVFLGLILLCIVALLYITLSTTVDVVKTYEARIEDNRIIILESGPDIPRNIYIYEDRDKVVYHLEIEPSDVIKYDDYNLIIPLGDFAIERGCDFVKVDIPIKEITLFRRVFLQGGRNE